MCNDCPVSAPTGEPLGQVWTDKLGQAWQPVPNTSFYRLYRGTGTTLPDLVTIAPDACLRLVTTETSTGPVLAETPAAGGILWYLVRAANPAGDGPAGDATSGPRQQQSSGTCP